MSTTYGPVYPQKKKRAVCFISYCGLFMLSLYQAAALAARLLGKTILELLYETTD